MPPWYDLMCRMYEAIAGRTFDLRRWLADARHWAGIDYRLGDEQEALELLEKLLGGRTLSEDEAYRLCFTCEETLAFYSMNLLQTGIIKGRAPGPPEVPELEEAATGMVMCFLLAEANRQRPAGFEETWFEYVFACSAHWWHLVEESDFVQFYKYMLAGLGNVEDCTN